jgi:hypothetical protein
VGGDVANPLAVDIHLAPVAQALDILGPGERARLAIADPLLGRHLDAS